jgi:hypothetical protein
MISMVMLVYCVGVVPIHLSFWDKIGICNRAPTLEADLLTDTYFLVGSDGFVGWVG